MERIINYKSIFLIFFSYFLIENKNNRVQKIKRKNEILLKYA
jgi:hypothetical protein